jgi:uncharacterized repeat protein (TIGR03803 family)
MAANYSNAKSNWLMAPWVVAVIGGMLPSAQGQITESVLHSFADHEYGASPTTGVIRDAPGNFYGTTQQGGKWDRGVVFKVDTSGNETVLHSFTGADGAQPSSGLTRDSAGNLYGTTLGGGSGHAGTLYKVDATGSFSMIYSFSPGAGGQYPDGGVVLDANGNFYGTTEKGGSAGNGVVYKIDSTGSETVLHDFGGRPADGAHPKAGVIFDGSGNLYGTTSKGGAYGEGTVFELDSTGHVTILHSFSGPDGRNPRFGVTRDASGYLYGTVALGGPDDNGVVYKVGPPGPTSSLTILHDFRGSAGGRTPSSGVILDNAGNLYGTTQYMGALGWGNLYELDPSGQETVLYNFSSQHGGFRPAGTLLRDEAGNLFGTASSGGPSFIGLVYKLDPAGRQTVCSWFRAGPDGAGPQSSVIFDSAGNLYGTTSSGGVFDDGVVFKVDPSGHESVIHNVAGEAPSGLVFDTAGNLYGTTGGGGPANAGTIFRIDPTGHETVLYNFTGGADGAVPRGVILDSAGNLYGATASGGSGCFPGCGVIYELDTSGNQTVLYTFTGGADGSDPATVIRDSAGNLYGSTVTGGSSNDGTLFKLDTTGTLTVLHTFGIEEGDGSVPLGTLTMDAAGNLYGTTQFGGGCPPCAGVVFKVDPSGTESILHAFSGPDGANPRSSVILDSAGNLYGTTQLGGGAGQGVVFMIDPSGNETTLYTFSGGEDGGYPVGCVTLDAAGNLYGTTAEGGKRKEGVVFELTGVAAAHRKPGGESGSN